VSDELPRLKGQLKPLDAANLMYALSKLPKVDTFAARIVSDEARRTCGGMSAQEAGPHTSILLLSAPDALFRWSQSQNSTCRVFQILSSRDRLRVSKVVSGCLIVSQDVSGEP